MADTFFTLDRSGDVDRFVATDHARGPWNPDACHAGPPTGLVARAAERIVDDKRLMRLTLDLVRPIPMAGFAIRSEVTRAGRAVATSAHAIVDDAGRECVRASALHVRTEVGTLAAGDGVAPHVLAEATPGHFPLRELPHGQPGFSGAGIEVRYPPGHGPEVGPTAMWMRTVALLPGEAMTPFQKVCPLADCVNGISRHADPRQVGFVNADLTILLHREPVGDWFCLDASSNWHDNGTGVAHGLLFDEHGTIGRAMQALLITPPPSF